MGEAIFTPPSGGKFSVKRTGEAELLVNGNIETGMQMQLLFIAATVWWEARGANEGILRVKNGQVATVSGGESTLVPSLATPVIEAAKEFLAMESQITPF